MKTPGVLVLGGGGILGEAWMTAVLAGLDEADGFDSRDCEEYIGTSAGSIVAASLVAGLSPVSRLGETASPPQEPFGGVSDEEAEESEARLTALRQGLGAAAALAGAAAAPLASFAFASTAGSGAMIRRTVLRNVRPGRRSLAELGHAIERTGAHWDGRLRVVAVELESGRRVVFGSPEAPQASVSLAVQASCAIPGVFRPVVAAGRSFVDGGAWSPTNMDASNARGETHVLCLNPTGSLRPGTRTLAGALGTVSRGVAATEALVLRKRGALVTTINPDPTSAAAMGANLMDPRRRTSVIEAGLAQGRVLLARAKRAA